MNSVERFIDIPKGNVQAITVPCHDDTGYP